MPQVIIIDEIGTELEAARPHREKKRCSTGTTHMELFGKPNKEPFISRFNWYSIRYFK
jgi:stage III sporulation protein SpoIIIAA